MKIKKMHKWPSITPKALVFIFIFLMNTGHAQLYDGSYGSYNSYTETINIKSINGKFYAYIVLLFNENPHFVNMIQKDSIPLKIMGNEGFHIKEYKNYLNTIRDKKLKNMANLMLMIYLEPRKFDFKSLHNVEDILTGRNIILKFSKDKNAWSDKISLDYCIFGKNNWWISNTPFLKLKRISITSSRSFTMMNFQRAIQHFILI